LTAPQSHNLVKSLHSPLLAFGRLTSIALWTLGGLATQGLALSSRLIDWYAVPGRWYRVACRLAGISVKASGQPLDTSAGASAPVLFVVNHISYLDIFVLGSLLRASFVAKSEVAAWPIFGFLSKVQRTVFVDRRARYAANQRDVLTARLVAGDSLILFPEGTSGCGTHTLPFKSALFSVAAHEGDHRPVTVQPVSLAYTRVEIMPMGRLMRPFFAWYGDMTLAPHLWRVLGLGNITVEVTFHEPVTLRAFGSRKALAAHCQSVIAEGAANARSGRRDDAEDPCRRNGAEDPGRRNGAEDQ
jgi:lyso-ornithine lipid O-acyltransferase